MKKTIFLILFLCLICGTCWGESSDRIKQTIGNVTFDAELSGKGISEAAIYKVRLKASDPNMDKTIMDLFDRILFRRSTTADILEKIDGDLPIRNYYTAEGKKQEWADYSFNDGTISAGTYDSSYYTGIMDIFRQYDGACYIPDRLQCGDLPTMSAESVAVDLHDVAVQLCLNIESTPYVLRAYSMNDKLASSKGIHPFLQMVIQGNDLTAENREIVSMGGGDCYFVAYRFAIDRIPVSYSYFYLEFQDFFTVRSHVYALYNNDGMISFVSLNQFEITESGNLQGLISANEAAEKVAEDLGKILGVDSFICKEIALEYVPLAFSGCDIEREAMLTPVWVFYFEGNDITPVLINAIDGTMID